MILEATRLQSAYEYSVVEGAVAFFVAIAHPSSAPRTKGTLARTVGCGFE